MEQTALVTQLFVEIQPGLYKKIWKVYYSDDVKPGANEILVFKGPLKDAINFAVEQRVAETEKISEHEKAKMAHVTVNGKVVGETVNIGGVITVRNDSTSVTVSAAGANFSGAKGVTITGANFNTKALDDEDDDDHTEVPGSFWDKYH